MSQVVVTRDELQDVRDKSKQQEAQINCDACLDQWQMSDATRTLTIERFIAAAFLPIIFFWLLVSAFLAAGFSLVLFFFHLAGKICSFLQYQGKR